ncbi:MAG TPA: hypothetical protein PK413_19415, partial [Thermoanaerobaculia bacterium]|nr:hypothetical protein [Thermoanaerobaculia bacterium]
RRTILLRDSHLVGQRFEYLSPPEEIPESPDFAVLFKAATLAGDALWVPTATEVLGLRLPTFERFAYLSLPSFNDLHHVRPTARGTLLVVSTGLDLVQELELSGRVLREWSTLAEAPWARFDHATDYRKVATTKPHSCHPNYAFEADGEIWVTRFEQRDAWCLTAPERRIALDVERPHDGIVVGRRVYFTTVDGRVVVASLDSDRVERVVDLNRLSGSELALGWCRGLAVLASGRVVVGFSRLRPTRFRENVRWVKHRLGLAAKAGNLPSRIACFDLEAEQLLWEQDLESEGLSAVFSIHPQPEP